MGELHADPDVAATIRRTLAYNYEEMGLFDSAEVSSRRGIQQLTA